MPKNEDLGENPRDRALAWRMASVLLSGLGVLMLAVIAFSAKSYVQAEASVVVTEALVPLVETVSKQGESVTKLAELIPKVGHLERLSVERGEVLRLNAIHDAQVDNAITRLTGVAEMQKAQTDRIQIQLDRIELFLRERERGRD